MFALGNNPRRATRCGKNYPQEEQFCREIAHASSMQPRPKAARTAAQERAQDEEGNYRIPRHEEYHRCTAAEPLVPHVCSMRRIVLRYGCPVAALRHVSYVMRYKSFLRVVSRRSSRRFSIGPRSKTGSNRSRYR